MTLRFAREIGHLEGRGRGSVMYSDVQKRVQPMQSDHIVKMLDLRIIVSDAVSTPRVDFKATHDSEEIWYRWTKNTGKSNYISLGACAS